MTRYSKRQEAQGRKKYTLDAAELDDDIGPLKSEGETAESSVNDGATDCE